jgi:hypothetical protein
LFKQELGSTTRAPQYSLSDTPEELKAIVVGKTDLLSVYVSDNTYHAVLSALSFRDYLETEEGCNLPVVMYNTETRKWIGLTKSLQVQIIFSFTKSCQRGVCTDLCHESICQTPALPSHCPSSMGLNLDKYSDLLPHTHTGTDTGTDTKSNGDLNSLESGPCFPVDHIQLVGAWKCTAVGNVLAKVFAINQPKDAKQDVCYRVWCLVEMGIIDRYFD